MTKFIEYLKIGLAAIGKFLRFAFAAEITIGVFGVLKLLAGHTLVGILILVWGVLLAVAEYKSTRI
jgi:hypothetical protein